MHKFLLYLTLIAFASIVAMGVVGLTNMANAQETDNLREEMTYGYDAMLERREEKERELQFLRYQQQEYRQQQQIINRLNSYNNIRHDADNTQYSFEKEH